jgi:hypothetical protein
MMSDISSNNTQVRQGGKDEVFSVSPEELTIEKGSEGMIFITFAPKSEGIYSGAMRIKYHKKSLTILLRGECDDKFKVDGKSDNPATAEINGDKIFQQAADGQQSPMMPSYVASSNHFQDSRRSHVEESVNFGDETTFTIKSNASPSTFKSKLMALQKKINEISRKSKLPSATAMSQSTNLIYLSIFSI